MNDTATLVRLADTDLTLADPADDVRGRMVVDTQGDEVVHIDADREQVAHGPAYDPELVLDRATTAHFYNYYGYAPYWDAGNMNPGFPLRPR